MSRKASAAVLITMMLPVMGTLTASMSAQGQTGRSVGLTCAYFSGSPFGTEVLNVEIDGLSPPPITRAMSCAAATAALMDRGFDMVDASQVAGLDFDGDGAVDASNYSSYRLLFPTPPNKRPGTTVITACAHFSGPAIRTELIGVEHHGPKSPPFVIGKSCAAAFSALMDQGFVLLQKGPTVARDLNNDGNVDAADYVLWRCHFGCF